MLMLPLSGCQSTRPARGVGVIPQTASCCCSERTFTVVAPTQAEEHSYFLGNFAEISNRGPRPKDWKNEPIPEAMRQELMDGVDKGLEAHGESTGRSELFRRCASARESDNRESSLGHDVQTRQRAATTGGLSQSAVSVCFTTMLENEESVSTSRTLPCMLLCFMAMERSEMLVWEGQKKKTFRLKAAYQHYFAGRQHRYAIHSTRYSLLDPPHLRASHRLVRVKYLTDQL